MKEKHFTTFTGKRARTFKHAWDRAGMFIRETEEGEIELWGEIPERKPSKPAA